MLLLYRSSLVLLVLEASPGITELVDLLPIHLLVSADRSDLSISEALKELKQYILLVFTEPIELFLRVGHVDMLLKFLR